MHVDGLDLNLLVALDALLSERSVTAAAEKAFVSQPAMSASLSKLRTHLSDPLLERSGREYTLTPLAQEIAPRVRDLLQEIRLLMNRKPQFNPLNDSRTIKIAMSGYCVKVFGVPAIKELSRRASHVRTIIHGIDADVFQRIQSSDLDYCVAVPQMSYYKPLSGPDRLGRLVLFDDHFVLVGDKSNKSLRPGISVEAMAQLRMVTTRQGSLMTSIAERSLQALAVGPRVALTVQSTDLALDAVIGTELVTIVPFRAFVASSQREMLRAINPPVTVPPLQEVLIWHKRIDGDPFHTWFQTFLQEFAASWALAKTSPAR